MAVPARFNKWSKYKFMRKAAGLAPHLPATSPLSVSSFREMAERYGKVVVKPVGGMQGQGIFHVSCLPDGLYEVQHENRKIKLAGRRKTYAFLSKKIGSQSYIVQQSIERATVGERAFDLRIIVQRKKNSSRWIVTGRVAKVVGSGYFVSNTSRKGKLLLLDEALGRSSLHRLSRRVLQERIDGVALACAKTLTEHFPKQVIYGIDIGLDRRGNVWIFEGNLYPAMSHFVKLKDKTMYRRIKAYGEGQ
ncbi:YheC/YheD family protein [Paenibacillus sp. UNC499MF]|uniref:YheC/YheD family protein n=1 Tax=Paenibacillus sp. UNC499MF TaxID=1502751 RepID=UPI0008A0531E|nr:YheC/YheD family protein [Paenibacillus sp. UNC499MF]SEG78479.1 YheC/D like ATP-grasp [Paenibacillus sp. UNC499MF]